MGNYHWKPMVTGYLVSLIAGMCVSLGAAMIFAVRLFSAISVQIVALTVYKNKKE